MPTKPTTSTVTDSARPVPAISLTALQATLLTAIAEKSVLVRTDTVQTFRGASPAKINVWVDEGKLRWVWDINNGRGRARQLRFLALEVFRPETTQNITLDDALRIILGETRVNFRCFEICHRMRLTHPAVYHLHQDGHLPGKIIGKTQHIARPSLETFLKSRWIGGVK